MSIPELFLKRMKDLLKDDYGKYAAYTDMPCYRALRVNTLKTDAGFLKKYFDFIAEPTKFCGDSYYIPDNGSKLGNHPLHHAGAFYLQEPSASSVIEAIGIEPGDRVLDLCAAPGGKSTQAAAKLKGKGLIVSNEYVGSRVQALVSNIERLGIVNAVVTSAHPDVLCPQFCGFFNKVIVDAPCSGEGMFRKEEDAVKNWSVENVLASAERQAKILDSAAVCVAPGGKLVYSTCTYSPEENEMNVVSFIKRHPEFCVIKPEKEFGMPAYPEFADGVKNIENARRIFNFHGGEGHFVAVMQRSEGEEYKKSTEKFTVSKPFSDFFKENFTGDVPENQLTVGDSVFLGVGIPELKKVRIVRNGIYCGNVSGNRFIPAHSLFNNNLLRPKASVDFSVGSDELSAFLHGDEIVADCIQKGFVGVTADGIPLGFGKISEGRLKNHYPKGLRIG